MKIIWEDKDIRPGRRVRRLTSSETWIIGYDPVHHSRKSPALTLTSLNDGMLSFQSQSQKSLAKLLTDTDMHPVELLDKENDHV